MPSEIVDLTTDEEFDGREFEPRVRVWFFSVHRWGDSLHRMDWENCTFAEAMRDAAEFHESLPADERGIGFAMHVVEQTTTEILVVRDEQ